MVTKKDDPYSLRRFIVRIAIPIVIASLIVAIARFIMTIWFNEKNVRPSDNLETKPVHEEGVDNHLR